MAIQNREIKRADTTSPKVNTLADLKTHIVDGKGRKVPHSVWGTDISRTEIINQNDGSGQTLNVGYTDRSGSPQPFVTTLRTTYRPLSLRLMRRLTTVSL